jgi:hypothetical protein
VASGREEEKASGREEEKGKLEAGQGEILEVTEAKLSLFQKDEDVIISSVPDILGPNRHSGSDGLSGPLVGLPNRPQSRTNESLFSKLQLQNSAM